MNNPDLLILDEPAASLDPQGRRDVLEVMSVALMTGAPVFSWLPLIATVLSCVLFIAVAIRRFNRQEF